MLPNWCGSPFIGCNRIRQPEIMKLKYCLMPGCICLLLVWLLTSGILASNTAAAEATNTVAAPVATGPFSFATKDQAVLTFGLDRIPALQRELPEGFPLWQYGATFIYIVLALLISRLLDRTARFYVARSGNRTRTSFSTLLVGILKGPVRIISFVILLHFGLRVFKWPAVVEDFLSKGLIVLVAFSITYTAIKLIDILVLFWRRRIGVDTDKAFDEQLFPVVRKTLHIFVIIVAILLTLDNLGVKITSMLASLSIGGVALGLAAQDTLANLFGAVAVFVDKPFALGDRIKLESIEGIVESIGLRSTLVRNLDGFLITIPNKTMGSATITNITRRPNIKTVMNIGITYDTSCEKVKQALTILDQIYKTHPMTFDVLISFNQFGDSALNIQVVHWWNSTDHKAYLQGMQEMNLKIKERFEEAGIAFAFPSRTLYLKQDSEFRLGNGA
jgi:MscS family membrane protein